MSKTTARLVILVSCFVASAGYLATQRAVLEISAVTCTALRFLLAALTLLCICRVRNAIVQADTLRAAFVPGAFLALGAYLLAEGLASEKSSVAAFLVCSDVFLVPVVELLLYGKRTERGILAGLAAGGIGLALLTLDGTLSLSAGAGYLLISAVTWAVYYSTLGRVVKSHDSVALACAVHCVAALLLAAITSPFSDISGPFSGEVVGILLFMGVLLSGIRFAFMTAAQKVIEPSELGLVLLLEPVFATLCGVVVAGEELRPLQWCGAAVVLAAIAIPLLLGKEGLLRRMRGFFSF